MTQYLFAYGYSDDYEPTIISAKTKKELNDLILTLDLTNCSFSFYEQHEAGGVISFIPYSALYSIPQLTL